MPRQQEGTLEVHLAGAKQGSTKLVPWCIDLPDSDSQAELGVLLLHGAGGDLKSGTLPALAACSAAAGFPCLRITTRGGNLEHRVSVTKAVLAAATSLPGLGAVQRWVLAGHSMGARVACSIANEQQQQQQQPVTAVLLSSYPLHPPGKPTELRDALLHALRVPALLIRGTKDPFSQAEQWEGALRRMSCSWQQHSVEGGDHGLRIGGKDGAAKSQQALEEVGAAVQRFLRQTADRGQQQRQQQAAGRGRGTAGRGRKRVAAVGSSPSEGGKKVARRQQK